MTKNPSAHAASSSHDGDESKYNIFRDSLLRYCGYANEVGESFRYQYPKFVVPSYGIAFGYCLADSVSSGYQVVMSEECDVRDDESPSISKEKRAGIAMLDTLLWVSN
jgi:fission process protein 1